MDDDAAPAGPSVQVVDPEVRAHIYSLVTAVSGSFTNVWLLDADDV